MYEKQCPILEGHISDLQDVLKVYVLNLKYIYFGKFGRFSKTKKISILGSYLFFYDFLFTVLPLVICTISFKIN